MRMLWNVTKLDSRPLSGVSASQDSGCAASVFYTLVVSLSFFLKNRADTTSTGAIPALRARYTYITLTSSFFVVVIAHAQDGTLDKSYFNAPAGVALDGDGNVWVADTGNHRIRRLTSAGVSSTFAGSGKPGFADRPGRRAIFNSPVGVLFVRASAWFGGGDALFVADTGNHRVRLVNTTTAAVETYAGLGTPGYRDNAIGRQAVIQSPLGLAFNSVTGDVYVSDGTHRIRKVSPSRAVTTLAGSGNPGLVDAFLASLVYFNTPWGLAIDDDARNVFVADSKNNAIRRISIANDAGPERFEGATVTLLGALAPPNTGGTISADGASCSRSAAGLIPRTMFF